MSLKGLHFSYNKFKTDVQSQIAKNNPMQKQDTKSLSMWIFQERSDLATMRTMAYQRTETVKALKDWVKEEVEEEKIENGRDLEVKLEGLIVSARLITCIYRILLVTS